MFKRDDFIKKLLDITSKDRVSIDPEILKKYSVDRYRKYTSVHGLYNVVPHPIAIVYVKSTSEVSRILKLANAEGINCVARTGGTATEGGLETAVPNSIVIDGSMMNKVIKIDEYNMQVTAECGVVLGDLEDQVRKVGLTIGHSPQSKPLAQIGGLVATRSIGQFSTLYGGIEDMVVGLEAVFPDGIISRVKNVPRRSAGPDIRHVIIGNEGALCYITEATLKLYKYMPQNNIFLGWTLDNMKTGVEALREVIVNGYRPSVARLYSEEDANQHFSHFANNKCVMIFMCEGPEGITTVMAEAINNIVSKVDIKKECKIIENNLIKNWFNNLNWGPDKLVGEKEHMYKHKNLGYTTEISCDWASVMPIYESTIKRIRETYPHAKDLTMLGAHSSHSYQNGTNLYFVYDYNINCEPEEEIYKYHKPLNAIIVDEALKFGGSMVHHHGIGKYRAEWAEKEHGSAFYILKGLKQQFDPKGIMNVGTIFVHENYLMKNKK